MAITSKATLPKSAKKGPRKSSSLPAETVEYLKAWMMSPEHIAHPYPTEPEKAQIMADTGIELKQLTNWFVNNRKRYWKPRVEARLQQQARAAAAAAQAHAAAVAVATASVHTNPVSPDHGYKPTITLPPGNGFVTFDLGSPSLTPTKLTSRYTHLVETDMARVIADQTVNAQRDERIVSESSSSGSSSGSVTASDEGTISDTTTYQEEETVHGSIKTSPTELQQQQQEQEETEDEQDYSSEQTTGESSSSVSIASISAAVSLSEESFAVRPTKKRVIETPVVVTEAPRKRFRRVSIELWRETCQNACHANDDTLPSLEEASQLFGFSQ
mmetsp:Transcript_41763/g.100566  ORF Transcript_41763/g.100566 Transcript_41763/m.100566 type:complete len:329 (+) Transcript_41763:180-1166(+)|eukprot:CAMPEP_0113627144 /NCGR_PEP_ID=MMETSP0017_2-20120614/14050_1 /TAXON_ID=2856 /ORGANISM="Cylindrotheca closterium" /LENGTH=328 /DNA_ID=CAMNT_0000537373 /DNA_START=143 /DNA_END=1129 /DNA_ORIENTATION=+ /assembly_acc=CAM_ASM_000147